MVVKINKIVCKPFSFVSILTPAFYSASSFSIGRRTGTCCVFHQFWCFPVVFCVRHISIMSIPNVEKLSSIGWYWLQHLFYLFLRGGDILLNPCLSNSSTSSSSSCLFSYYVFCFHLLLNSLLLLCHFGRPLPVQKGEVRRVA